MHKKQASTAQTTTAKRQWLWLVLFGFLWLQFAGLAHKYAHAPEAVNRIQISQSIDKLFPQHAPQDELDCQLLDLQCGGFALSQALPILTLPVFALQMAQQETAAFFTLLQLVYQARAPPQSSI